jgi:hypothetical protein
MSNATKKPDGSRSKRPAAQAMLTTAFMTDAGAALPKGAAGFTFRAPSNAVEVLAGTPRKVKPLLQGYGEAVAQSRSAGRAVSFRVEVDPSGGTTVSPIEETVRTDAAGPTIEYADVSDADLRQALEEARERGRGLAAQILASDDMLSADQFAQLLGTSRVTINTKRQNHQVLGLDGAKRGFRFPAWQVDENGKPFSALPALFERLGGGPWSVYRFLVQSHPEMDGLTGREALRSGKVAQALEVADSIAHGTFT